MMEYISLVILIIFILTKIFELIIRLFSGHVQKTSVYDNYHAHQYIDIINGFIRREVSIEILKWLMEGRVLKDTNTLDTTFINQITNSDEIKKRTSALTNVISTKISPEIHVIFNYVYKKALQYTSDNKSSLDITLQEYIARYVLFMFRRLTYDITTMINAPEYKTKKIEAILNAYIVKLEETIYKENDIYLVNPSISG
jgi:hypothetical protein